MTPPLPFDPSDIIQLMGQESSSYTKLEDIEKLVDTKGDLSMLPVQPLHFALKDYTAEQIAQWLPSFSKRQRQSFIDIDIWEKDELGRQDFALWVAIYALCPDQKTVRSFVTSDTFSLFLKSFFNIWTFDEEEPEYPDHNCYFLTEDHLLLFEYSEEFELAKETKYLLKVFYSELGLEKAYRHLVDLVSDSYSVVKEHAFEQKTSRLKEIGIVDYYDALELRASFKSEASIVQYLQKKGSFTATVDSLAKNQMLDQYSVRPFVSKSDRAGKHLKQVKDETRLDYLQFNFVRTINAQLSLENAWRKPKKQLQESSELARNWIDLGLSYVEGYVRELGPKQSAPIFERLDFWDLCRIGHSLMTMRLEKMKRFIRQMKVSETSEQEAFLGRHLQNFLELSFLRPPKVVLDSEEQEQVIDSMQMLTIWDEKYRLFEQLLPFANQFYKSFCELKDQGLLRDEFYLNYVVSDIDFEAIILSSLMSFDLVGQDPEKSAKKLGLSIAEFQGFYSKYIGSDNLERFQEAHNKELSVLIQNFQKTFGLSGVENFCDYLFSLLKEHLHGYDFSSIEREDFSHVGGPILLAV